MDHEHDQERKHEQDHNEERERHEGEAGFVVNDRRHWNLSDEELDQEEEPSELPSYVEQLQAQLEEKDKQLREYIQAYKGEVGVGLQKTKDRLERDAEQHMGRVRGELALPMLDVLEALERSVMSAQSSGNPEALMQGVQMTYQLMVQKLGELGLNRIDCVGQPFDPNLHEAVAVAPVTDPAEHNLVVQEFRPGFAMGERIIRAAQVQVGKHQ